MLGEDAGDDLVAAELVGARDVGIRGAEQSGRNASIVIPTTCRELDRHARGGPA